MEGGVADQQAREAVRGVSKLWWLWLVFGIGWTIIGVVILQFDQASINTVGILVGAMFLATGLQQFVIMGLAERGRWVFGLFGVLFIIAGIIALISPENTFAALADILGFLFLIVGVFWIIQAFLARELNELWWLGLLAGILMVILAFWTGGQFFIEKAYVLLVFAGIWALMQGITDIVRAFQIKKLDELV
ncbi:MAG: HdeD family acid-resistance protein [Solirubrobacterales bacterium]